MDPTILSCIFPIICAMGDLCAEAEGRVMQINARIIGEAEVAQVWHRDPAELEPGHVTWLGIRGRPSETWVLHSASELHGTWTVSYRPASGAAVATYQMMLGGEPYGLVGTGGCEVTTEAAN